MYFTKRKLCLFDDNLALTMILFIMVRPVKSFFICNFSNDVANFGNGCKMNYIARNLQLVKEELIRERLFKLQAKALLDALQS